MAPARKPDLSVIIPSLNEEAALPLLLDDLLCQEGVEFEVLVSDGGSTDATCPLAKDLLVSCQMSHQILTGLPGRGRQLNRAVQEARGDWLLFLHADSRLPEKTAIAHGIHRLQDVHAAEGTCRVAAHFTLQFDVADGAEIDFDLFLSQAKAQLDEPGCTHGDQGFLLSRRFFEEVGPFREDLPVMEDTWLAESVRRIGRWELLSPAIRTSPRRFQSEGLQKRQILNALLVNFLFVGWDDFLQQAPDLYRQQADTGRLQLLPFWVEIKRQLRQLPIKKRFCLWYDTGRFVRSQAWQLVFRRAAWRLFLHEGVEGVVNDQGVHRFRRWFEPLTNHPVGALSTGLLVWCWFSLFHVRLLRDER